MALSYQCPYCDERVVLKFVKTGEIAKCKSCGKESRVPENAEEIDDSEWNIQRGIDSPNHRKSSRSSAEDDSDTFSELYKGLGWILVVIGGFLVFGNVTGEAPTLPFAGFVTMTIGGWLISKSRM